MERASADCRQQLRSDSELGTEPMPLFVPRLRRPYIPAGLTQQGRHPDGRRAMTHDELRHWPWAEHSQPGKLTEAELDAHNAEMHADALAAQAEGARMAMGDLAPSAPMPLAPRSGMAVGTRWGNVVGWAIVVLVGLAVLAVA